MPSLGTPEILVIALVVLVLFGSAKLPKAARSLGQSMRIFKAETKGLRGEDDDYDLQGRSSAERAPLPPAVADPVPPVAQPAPVTQPAPVAPPASGEQRPEQH